MKPGDRVLIVDDDVDIYDPSSMKHLIGKRATVVILSKSGYNVRVQVDDGQETVFTRPCLRPLSLPEVIGEIPEDILNSEGPPDPTGGVRRALEEERRESW